jgi:DNA-binding IclR family transcriptional regulator
VTYMGKPNTTNPIWISSTGKVLLGQLPGNELEIVLNNIELLPLTPYTITDKQLFKKEIALVQERGYGTSFNEESLGVASVSVPIRNYSKPVALSIVGPNDRFGPHIKDVIGELKTKAGEISEDLIKVRNLIKPEKY